MPTFQGQTADQVWIQALQFFSNDGGCPVLDTRTGATREVLHANFVITEPLQRWVVSRHPPLNPAFAIAELVWIITGREDAAFLNVWNSQLPKFAGEGSVYYGAYGSRLRHRFGIDQIQRVYHVLSQNPSTRQAVLQMWDPSLDLPAADGTPAAADIPCNVCAFLKVRDRKLEWMQVLRSNDLILGVPYNFIQFTSIQEVIAGWLGVQIGSYHHLSDSLHIYERDLETLRRSRPVGAVPNTDSLAMPKDKSDKIFERMALSIQRLAEPTLLPNELVKIADDASLPQSYKNLLLIVAAEAARRRKWCSVRTEVIRSCTNRGLLQAWDLWAERFAMVGRSA